MFRVFASALPVALSTAGAEQLGHVSGTPSWPYLMVDKSAGFGPPTMYTMNQQGASVWQCKGIGNAKDLLPSGNIVTVHRGGGLAEVDAACQDVVKGSLPADGHEARIDGIDNTKVLGITRQGCLNQKLSCEGILHFDRPTGQDLMPIDLGDHFDPNIDWGYLSTDSDWMHTNAVATGINQNFLVSIRHLSAVASFGYTTYDKQWVLSSEISSNFTFDKEDSKFYNPHDVHQLPNGNLLLFDNGNARNANISNPFSRGVEYALDWTTMTASLVWEYRTAESPTMGAMRRLSNGNTLVTCSHCESQYGQGIVYEVDASGKEVSRVELAAKYPTYRAQAVASPPHSQRTNSMTV